MACEATHEEEIEFSFMLKVGNIYTVLFDGGEKITEILFYRGYRK